MEWGWWWKGGSRGRDLCIVTADLHCCTTATNTHCKAIILQLKIKKKKALLILPNCPPTSKNFSHCGRELISSSHQSVTLLILLDFAKSWLLVWRLGASLVAQMVKHLPAMWETWVRSLGREDSLKRKWQPAPILLPRKSHGWRSLVQATVHGVAKSRHD